MNFSGISEKTFVGKVLRLPLRLIPPETALPIVQGRLRGRRWIVGSSDHGCWLGSYEYKKRLVFERLVAPGSVVFDVGANVGFYTLLASILVGPRGRVFAFEPVPCNLFYLKKHLELNRISNVAVIEAAVSDKRGVASLALGPSGSMAHFSPQGSISSETCCLDELLDAGAVPAPQHIKIDVEGAEFLVLSGARSLLTRFHPTVHLSTDVGETHQQCCSLLQSLGYKLQPIELVELDEAYEILALAYA